MTRSITLKAVLLEEAEGVYVVTEHLFRRVTDDDLSWKPATGRNWMTVGQLLMHCAAYGCGEAVRGFVRGDWPFDTEHLDEADHLPSAAELPSVDSVDQAMALLEADRSLALSCLGEVDEEDLLTKRSSAPWGGPEVSLFQHLLQMIQHLAQHKGQLFYYLKLMGRDVDSSDLWGG
jgi:uncharacterized damage-inducible protein DinB